MWLKNGYWYARINGKQVSLRTTSKSEAKQNYLKFLKEDKKTVKSIYLYEAVRNYLKLKYDKRSPYAMNLLKPFFNKRLHTLDEKEIDAYLLSLKKRSYPSYNISLRAFFNFVKKEYGITITITKIKQNTRLTILTEQEEGALKMIDNYYLLLAVTILLQTGMRSSELINLKGKDILWDSEFLFIKGKRKSSGELHDRTIPIPPIMLSESHFKSVSQDERVFSLWRDYNALGLSFRRYKEKLGLRKEICIHSLRHTFATKMIRKGMPLPILQKWLGHTTLRSTEKYLHLEANDLNKYRSLL
jgi:integrase/recombinase XerD